MPERGPCESCAGLGLPCGPDLCTTAEAFRIEGDRWRHTTCGEAGVYCDSDCHFHDHTTAADGSVWCHEFSEVTYAE